MRTRYLYAAGFNAHGQLNLNEAACASQLPDKNPSPDQEKRRQSEAPSLNDVPVFEKIIEGEALALLDACWSQTFGQ